MKKQRLEALLAQCEQELEEYNKKFNRCSFIRAAVALVTLVSLVAALSFRFLRGLCVVRHRGGGFSVPDCLAQSN